MIKLVILCMLLLNNVYATETPAKVSVDGSNKVTGTLNINDAIELGSNGSITAASGTFNSLSATDITGVTNISASSITISTIDVTSSFRLSPGAGVDKLLISDADGYASWFTPPNFAILDATQTFTGENTFTYVKADLVHSNNIGRTEGLISTPTITSDGTATVSISSTSVLIRDNDSFTGNIVYAVVPATSNFTLTDNSINFIYVNYNNGSPIYEVSVTDTLANSSNYLRVARLYISGGAIEYLFYNGSNALGNPSKNYERVMRVRGINGMEIESGFALTEATERVVNVSAGVSWFGLERFTIAAQSSLTSPCHYWTHSSTGGWIETSTKAYINDVYDTATGTQTLTNNRYAVNYIYGNGKTGEIDIYLGMGDYTASQAAAAAVTLPSVAPQTNWFYLPVGSIVVMKGASTATTIYQYTKTAFTANVNTIDTSQIISGTIDTARLPNIPPALVDLSTVTAALNLKANIAGQTFTGDITAPNISATYGITAATGTLSAAFKYIDGNQALGRILTSDADGNASWEVPTISGQGLYYLTSTVSDISGYNYLELSISSTVAISTTTWSGLVEGTQLSSYTTHSGYPGLTRIQAGTWAFNTWLAKTGGTQNMSIYAEVYKRTGTVETLLFTSAYSAEVTEATPNKIAFTGVSTEDIDFSTEDRLVVKYFAHIYGVGSAPTLESYKGGTYYAELGFPMAAVNATNFVPYTGALNDVNLNSKSLTASTITATLALYGSGENLTGMNTEITNNFTNVANDTTTISNTMNDWFGEAETMMNDLSVSTDSLASTKYDKSGGTVSGQVTITSSMTVQGNAFSVGTSTFVVTGGKVGIGTDSPFAALDVRGNITSQADAGWTQIIARRGRSDSISDQAAFIAHPYDSLTTINPYWAVGLAPATVNRFHIATYDGSTYKERLNISTDGFVGIGTASPSYNLDVYGSGAALRVNGNASASHLYMAKSGTNYAQLAVDGTGTYFDYGGSLGKLFFRAGVEGTTKATLDASGNAVFSGSVKASAGIVGNNTATQYGAGFVGEYGLQANNFTNWHSTSVAAGVVYQTIKTNTGNDMTVTLSKGIWEVNLEVSLWNGNSAVNIYSVGIGLSTDSGFSTFSDIVELGGSGGNMKYIPCLDLTQAREGLTGGSYSRIFAVSSQTTIYPKMRISSPSGVTFNIRAQLYATRIQ